MDGLRYSASSDIESATQLIGRATEAGVSAQQWCLRANTANWESPAAAIFSRWLAELVLTSRRSVDQIAEVSAQARFI